jgi:hypothetical protein
VIKAICHLRFKYKIAFFYLKEAIPLTVTCYELIYITANINKEGSQMHYFIFLLLGTTVCAQGKSSLKQLVTMIEFLQDSFGITEHFSNKIYLQNHPGYNFQRDVKHSNDDSPYYRLKVGDSVAFATLCSLINAKNQAELIVNLNKDNQIVDIDLRTYKQQGDICDDKGVQSLSLNITVKQKVAVLANSYVK